MSDTTESIGGSQSLLKEIRQKSAVTLKNNGVNPKTIAEILEVDVATVYSYLRNYDSDNDKKPILYNNHLSGDNFTKTLEKYNK
jgi:predicted transcriptional regulator